MPWELVYGRKRVPGRNKMHFLSAVNCKKTRHIISHAISLSCNASWAEGKPIRASTDVFTNELQVIFMRVAKCVSQYSISWY